MNIYSILNNYTRIKECPCKGEHYSVRDSGAVLRHTQGGRCMGKDDNTWTFGKPNEDIGYMEIGTERVYRIVTLAFLGGPPTPQHIVDHIDTDYRNNRSQNLRWLARSKNALSNPITRKEIEYLYGNIEALVNDLSVIQEFVDGNLNYEQMRAVIPEKTRTSCERLCTWVETKNNEKSLDGTIGEWIYTPYGKGEKKPPSEREQHNVNVTSERIGNIISIGSYTNNPTESLAPNAIQRHQRTPTEFPLYPPEVRGRPPTIYLGNLEEGAVITKNQYATCFIDNFVSYNGNRLVIITHADDGIKKFSVIVITFGNGGYVYEGATFFEEQSAQGAFALAQGLKWGDEDGINGYY